MTKNSQQARRTAVHRIVIPREENTSTFVMERAEEFNKTLPVQFRNIRYLVVALTHSSFASEHHSYTSNEKLEFVGDGIVNFIVAKLLFLEFPDANEGDLSKMRAALVKEQGMNDRALELGLDRYLLLGKGEDKLRDERKPAILADGFEALVAALYFDKGMHAAERFVSMAFHQAIADLHSGAILDHKTALQEETQRGVRLLPTYATEVTHADDGTDVFTSRVYVGSVLYGEGRGSSKKRAEEDAARAAYEAFVAEHPHQGESVP
ncbi:MAG TPA: ribonuclease III [Candidatus Cryosericum sp.]